MIESRMARRGVLPAAAVRAWPVLLLAAFATGCGHAGAVPTPPRPVPADRVVDFATLFGRNCAGCHGAEGKLGPAPPLNDPIFLAIVPDSVAKEVISGGRSGTPMPAFARSRGGSLTDEQVSVLAAGLKSRWGAAKHERSNVPGYSTDKGTPAGDADRGAKVFEQACSGCHGPDGEGDDAGAIHDPAFLALISDQCLRRLAITGRPDLGMPDFAGKDGRDDDYRAMTSAEVADLVAFIARWRKEGNAVAREESKRAGR